MAMVHDAHLILIGGAVITAAVFAASLATRLRLPALVLFAARADGYFARPPDAGRPGRPRNLDAVDLCLQVVGDGKNGGERRCPILRPTSR
jgi:hypothetical protein